MATISGITYNVVNPYAAVNIPGFNAGSNGLTQMANFGLETTTINSSTVNDVRLVYLRDMKLSGVPVRGTRRHTFLARL